ncbi:MAG: Asp-tRNA(Asn)/Glu-tRNA(Gln) amidotransferase subunit GatC [Acidimicrobiales bacterium]
MPAEISKEQVAHVAFLSRLAVTDEEINIYAGQLSKILEHVSDIEALDLEDVQPMAHPIPLENVYGEDVPEESLLPESFLSMAPHAEESMFYVPRIIGEAP